MGVINEKFILNQDEVEFDFKGVNIKITGWSKDYIQIKSIYHKRKEDIVMNDNKISLVNFVKPNSKIYTLSSYRFIKSPNQYTPIDFEVTVPEKMIVSINSNFLRAINTSIRKIDCNEILAKDCYLVEDFLCLGNYGDLKRCTINKKGDLSFEKVIMDDCIIE